MQPEDLADRLLRGPASPAPPRAPRWGRFAVGAFVAYHLLAILLGNLPQREDDLVGRVSGALGLRRYLDVTASWQRWNMFAPNPVRRNEYMKVVVTDADGRTWDVPDDIRLRRRYPYLAYDRRAKVSRRMMDHPWYQRVYGAWMCREWERTHGGRPARKLQLVWEHSKVPSPTEAFPPVGYDWEDLPLKVEMGRSIDCARTVWGQLPDEHRARYGLPPRDPQLPPFVPQQSARVRVAREETR